MAYDTQLADRIREYLADLPDLEIEEKKMFRGLAFMVNGKMCVNVSGENLMCRFDPERMEELAGKRGFEPMIMKGRELSGYCYISPEGIKTKKELAWFIDVCLEFNEQAKVSKKKKNS
ncbi:MAG: hypothetical protein K0S33_2473 [Bacteroidetes bacterium]|jgi:hypothetical protein|nr:hypothetical protein [Bacteroidota bacterium]